MHHILPKSFGGNNIVCLTFKEHYICHLLLPKFTIGKDKMKMCFAMHTFFHFDKNRNMKVKRGKLYETHKKMFIQACKERIAWVKSDIFIFKHKNTKEEFIGTRSEFSKYSNLSSQAIYMILSSNNKVRYCNGWSVFIPEKNCFSDELIHGGTGIKKEKNNLCQYCNNVFDKTNFNRWHDEKCKNKIIFFSQVPS
jgi:hypothetical protein